MGREIRNDIIKCLSERGPNWVREGIILRDLSIHSADEVKQYLKQLVGEKKIVETVHRIEETDIIVTTYALKSYADSPINSNIEINGVKVPRLMDRDLARAEDTNVLAEELLKYSKVLDSKIDKAANKYMRKHAANIIALFSLFLALISFITFSFKVITINPEISKSEFLIYNIFQILPPAIVLFVFAFLLIFFLKE